MLFRTTLLVVSALIFLSFPSYAGVTIVGNANITVAVEPAGSYSIAVPERSWVFGGDTGAALSNITTVHGADSLGGYAEIGFDFQAGVARHASIRVYL